MNSPAQKLIARVAEMAERAKNMQCGLLPNVPLPLNPVQMPFWQESVRSVPNGFLRSALFGAIAKGRRRHAERLQLATFNGFQIFFTGQRLDQGDLDVYASVLHAMRLQRMGERCRMTAYSLLKLLGQSDTGKNRATLHKRLTRLRSGTVEIRQSSGYHYIGSLIDEAFKEEETQQWVIVLNPNLEALFADDQFTQVEWAVRYALNGKPLAQWLHGFYATHAKPYPIRMETLLKLCGSEDCNPRSAHQTLRRALDALADASKAHGQSFRYKVNGDLVCVEKTASRAQQRHLAKKAEAPRKPLPRYRSSAC